MGKLRPNLGDKMSDLREGIIEICLPEWGRGWDEEVCKCEECLGRANKRADQVLSLVCKEIEGVEFPDWMCPVDGRPCGGAEKARQFILEKIRRE